MNKRDELCVITMEECGELTQACSKIIRRGKFTPKLRQRLTEEAGDVLCMLEIMIQRGMLDRADLDHRVQVKHNKLKKWSSLFDDTDKT